MAMLYMTKQRKQIMPRLNYPPPPPPHLHLPDRWRFIFSESLVATSQRRDIPRAHSYRAVYSGWRRRVSTSNAIFSNLGFDSWRCRIEGIFKLAGLFSVTVNLRSPSLVKKSYQLDHMLLSQSVNHRSLNRRICMHVNNLVCLA